MRIVAVTSCPTGIAHTYMAAEALEQEARRRGHTIDVETQGAAGAETISPDAIAAADVAVFAADVDVRDRDRFAHLPVVTAPVKRAVNDSAGLLDEAEARVAAAPATLDVRGPAPADATREAKLGPGAQLRQWLMTGVSYMIPFVAAGGILIALSFMIGGPQVATKVAGGTFHGVHYAGVTDYAKLLAHTGWAGVLYEVGSTAFTMLVPILAGFIAYGIADRQGLVPGIVGGLIASAIHAGFLGGLIAGLLAGGLVVAIGKVPVPKGVRGVMPVVVVPLLSTTVVGVLMITLIGGPVASIMSSITSWLNGLGGSNAVLLGALLGLMMAFDMGGPINKTAYTFAVASLSTGNTHIMAAVIAAGMTPPLALALATVLRPRLFSPAERKAGTAAWLLGASFITEGAIPFAAGDPLRVIPSLMVGSATAGAISLGAGVSSPAPHGGVWIIGLVGDPLVWLAAIVAGTAVSCGLVLGAKSIRRRPVEAPATTSLADLVGAPAATTSAPSPAMQG
jgi:PTS system fructose-specific IIC component